MPANTLTVVNTIRVAEDVEDRIFNYRPSDAPLISAIDRIKV